MSRKYIFISASVLMFFLSDLIWAFPSIYSSLPQFFSWFSASALAGFQMVALIYEWHYWGASDIL